MAAATLDVVGIGNAIVDVIAQADDAFCAREGLAKGSMQLIDAARAEALYAAMGPGSRCPAARPGIPWQGSPRSAALAPISARCGTTSSAASSPMTCAPAGIRFDTPALEQGPPTARCLILVTRDAQRTMGTFLGACVELGPEDIPEALIASAQVSYLEGYLFDPPRAKAAFQKAAELAHGAGRKVSLTLSDAFCVERYRAEFRALIAGHVDILFANEAEIGALYETKDFDAALRAVRGHCEIAALTRSEKGSVVVTAKEALPIPAAPVARLVDTTGAGDLYASGFLFGLTHGRDLATCGRLGSLAAAEVIGHYGARPEASLAALAAKAGLI